MAESAAGLRLFPEFHAQASLEVQDGPAQEIHGAFKGPAIQMLVIVMWKHVGPDNGKQRSGVQLCAHKMKGHSDVHKIGLLESKEDAMIALIVRQVTTMNIDCHRA